MGWFVDRFRKKEGVSPEIDNEKEEIVPNSGGMRADSPGGTALKVAPADTPSVNLKVDTGNAALKVQTSPEPVGDAQLKIPPENNTGFKLTSKGRPEETSSKKATAHEQMLLGLKYLNGIIADHNFSKADHWITLAAINGDSDAQYYLGTMYENNKGRPRSRYNACQWYEKAAEQGNDKAAKALERLKKDRVAKDSNGEMLPIADFNHMFELMDLDRLLSDRNLFAKMIENMGLTIPEILAIESSARFFPDTFKEIIESSDSEEFERLTEQICLNLGILSDHASSVFWRIREAYRTYHTQS